MKRYVSIISAILFSLLLCFALSACKDDAVKPDNTAAKPTSAGVTAAGNLVNGGLIAETGKYTFYIQGDPGEDSDGFETSLSHLYRKAADGTSELVTNASGGLNADKNFIYYYSNHDPEKASGIYRADIETLESKCLYVFSQTDYEYATGLVLFGDSLYFCTSKSINVLDLKTNSAKSLYSAEYLSADSLAVTSDGSVYCRIGVAGEDINGYFKVNDNGTLEAVIASPHSPVCAVTDGSSVYWIDCPEAAFGSIYSTPLSGGESKKIANTDAVCLNIKDDRLWFCTWGEKPYACTCKLDGSDMRVLRKQLGEYDFSYINLCFGKDMMCYVMQGSQFMTEKNAPIFDINEFTPGTVPAPTTTASESTQQTTPVVVPAPEDKSPEFPRVTASSYLRDSSNGNTYVPENVLDGDFGTAWCEGVDGVGIGEWIALDADTPQTVSGLNIANGYWADESLYLNNGVVTGITVESDDGTKMDLEIPFHIDMGFDTVDFPHPVTTQHMIIRISSAEAGLKYSDTCITEIKPF